MMAGQQQSLIQPPLQPQYQLQQEYGAPQSGMMQSGMMQSGFPQGMLTSQRRSEIQQPTSNVYGNQIGSNIQQFQQFQPPSSTIIEQQTMYSQNPITTVPQ